MENVYVKNAATGEIQSIAHRGDPKPGGGVFNYMFGPVLNNQGDILFEESDMPFGLIVDASVFLHSGGTTIAIACPGDPMPGGGHLVGAGPRIGGYCLNNRGDVTFDATVDTDDNGDGLSDTGLYVFSHGSLHLVARTGTVLPGMGTIAHLQPPGFVGAPFALSLPQNNDRRQVLFGATLSDGRGVLLLATPEP